MDMTLITKFSKIKQITYSLIASPQPPVKISGCAPCCRERKSLFLTEVSVLRFLVAEFKKDDYTVGRDAKSSLTINETHLSKVDLDLVSKKHFKISRKKDGVYLEGFEVTYVNDKKISPGEKIILNHNDRIAIGKLHLKGRYCCNDDVHRAQWIET
jgi:hypothetical protein